MDAENLKADDSAVSDACGMDARGTAESHARRVPVSSNRGVMPESADGSPPEVNDVNGEPATTAM